MFNRQELKRRAKTQFKFNYWRCVVVAWLLALCVGTQTTVSFKNDTESVKFTLLQIKNAPTETVIFGITVGIIVGLAIAFLLLNPLHIGAKRFFLKNAEDSKTSFKEVGYGFKHDYWNNVGTMILVEIFVFLWTLLFIIPGIVKKYAYRMVPYIMADNPTISGTEAIQKSQEMMMGNKFDVFVMDLTFIGWNILSILTLGLVGFFYSAPYQAQTNANLYHALKAKSEESKESAE